MGGKFIKVQNVSLDHEFSSNCETQLLLLFNAKLSADVAIFIYCQNDENCAGKRINSKKCNNFSP